MIFKKFTASELPMLSLATYKTTVTHSFKDLDFTVLQDAGQRDHWIAKVNKEAGLLRTKFNAAHPTIVTKPYLFSIKFENRAYALILSEGYSQQTLLERYK